MLFKRTASFLFLILIQFSEQQNQKLKVTVLYESLCPDSARFIKEQLEPNYNTLKECISVELVPYGKAEHTPGPNTWTFTCQNLKPECDLNRYHACGITYATSEEVQIKFVNCLMQQTTPAINVAANVETCAKNTGVDYGKIKTCYDGFEGDTLLAGHGDRTRRLAPHIRLADNKGFIPTIIFNEVFSQQYHDAAYNHFVSAVQTLAQYCGTRCGTCQQPTYPYWLRYQPCVYPCYPYAYT